MELAQPQYMFPPLPCSAIVYRAILNKRFIDRHNNNRITSGAFFKRLKESGNDRKGLSVDLANQCTIEEVRAPFRACFGVATLHVGRIRDIALDVEQDTPKHANITGVPYKEDDLVQAERLAGLLAKQARLAWSLNP